VLVYIDKLPIEPLAVNHNKNSIYRKPGLTRILKENRHVM